MCKDNKELVGLMSTAEAHAGGELYKENFKVSKHYNAPELDVLVTDESEIIRTSNEAGDNEVPLFPTGEASDLNQQHP